MSRDLVGSRIPLAILQGPFEFCIGLLSVVFGGGVFFSVLLTALPTFTAVQMELPFWLTIAWGVMLTVGGGGVALAMLLRARWPNAVLVEAALLPTLGAGWTVYAVGLGLGIGAAGLVPILIGALITLACILRVIAIVAGYTITRQVVALKEDVK